MTRYKKLQRPIPAFLVACLLLIGNHVFSQKSGKQISVAKSSIIDFKTIEAYSRAHPFDPNEKRIASNKNGSAKEEEGEEEMKDLKVPKNAKIMRDPFGKMPTQNAPNIPSRVDAVPSPTPIIDFNGIDDNNNLIPPDVGGQVGPNHVMTTLNTELRISTRTGTVLSTVTLNAFFSSLGNPNTFDPKIIYDPYNSRWIITACANSRSASSALLIGVSQTNNPTGSWNLYSTDADAGNTNWFDYPSIGFNKDWIVVTGNMYTNSVSNGVGGRVFIYKKADLYAGVASPAVTTINPGSTGYTLVPAITYDNAISTMYLTQNYNSASGLIGFYTITGAIGSEVLSAVTLVSTPNTWSGSGPTNFAPQAGSVDKIACNDARMQKTIYRNGKIWCTHTVFLPAGVPTRSSIQWWQLSPAAAVLQRGRIDDATGTNFYAFPSIDVNQNDDALIGCATFNAEIFPSACYALRINTDAVNTFREAYVYKDGIAKYGKYFGGPSNRWGDYSSVSVDPNNGLNFWTVQEYARLPADGYDRWGTWWANVSVAPRPYVLGAGFTPVSGNINGITSLDSGETVTVNLGLANNGDLNTNSLTATLLATGGITSPGAAQNYGVLATGGATVVRPFSFKINGACGSTLTATLQLTDGTYTTTVSYNFKLGLLVPLTPGSYGPVCSNISTIPLSGSPAGGVWSGTGVTGNTFNTSAGTQTLTYTYFLPNDCDTSATTTIIINARPAAPIITPNGPTAFCNGSSVLLTSNVVGNNALSFTQANSQYVTVPHSASINLGATFSIEAWVKYSGNIGRTIIDKGDYDFLWQLNANNSGNKMGFYNKAMAAWSYSTGAVPQNTWTHVAITLNAGTLTFYINGVASGTAAVSFSQDVQPMNIGRQQPTSCGCNHFNGKMDELRLWNVARTQTELQNNMNTVAANSAGLVAYYKFDETTGTTAADATSNANNGTLVNGPTWQARSSISWSPGGATTQSITATAAGSYVVSVSNDDGCSNNTSIPVTFLPQPVAPNVTASGSTSICTGQSVTLNANMGINNALSFNSASSQYITVPHSASINLGATFSIEAWVNYSGQNRTIIDKGDFDYLWQLNPNTNLNKMGVYNKTTGLWYYSTGTVPQNTWTHVAITFSASTVRFYINGVASGTAATTFFQDAQPMNIGRQQPTSCACNHFNGSMDELRIWNDVRTPTEIQTYMNTTVATNSAGLVAYYKFDAGTGNIVADATANGNNGTFVNAPTWQVPSASPVNRVVWSPGGATTPTITVSTSGTYIATVTNGFGCTDTTSTVVTFNNTAAPSLGPDVTVNKNCFGETTNLTTLFNTTGLTPSWNTGNTTTAPPGTYRLVAANGVGCTDTAFANVILEVATWTGTVSNDWNTAGNWNINKVPGTFTHVIVPGGTPNPCYVNTVGAVAASVQVRSGGNVRTTTTKSVAVNGKCLVLPPN